MTKTEMFINCVPGEECRIAIVSDGKLRELYQERTSHESHVGNIYKGRVLNVESSIQAAFVDFGLERNGFLHVSDLHPRYFPGKDGQDAERVGKKTPHRDRPPIQKCLKRGQEVLVQILKEGIGTKGPTLTSYLSIPGRYLVMMPNMERMGVSRKIDDDDARRAVRKILDELNPPKDFGFIIRTAGLDKTKVELKRDLAYLQRLWRIIEKRKESNLVVGELYAESDLVIRTIRDVFSSDIERIIVDDGDAASRAQDYLKIASPRSSLKVFLYQDKIPLFHRYEIECQIDQIGNRAVELPSGGSIVIDSTEALVAIDVNSGKMRDNSDSETTAYKTNLEAVDEICRQLRLRDLGGVIVLDLIDMRQATHRRTIEQKMRNNLKDDRARTKTLSISQLGILEMTRQRMRPSYGKSDSMDCPQCQTTGRVKNPESVVLESLRRLNVAMYENRVARVEVTISPDVAFQLLNRKRADLVALEERFGVPVVVRVNNGAPIDAIEIVAKDERGGTIDPGRDRPGPDDALLSSASTVADLRMHSGAVSTDSESEVPPEPTGDIPEESSGQGSSRGRTRDGDAAKDAAPKRRRRRGRRSASGESEGDSGSDETSEESGEEESKTPSSVSPGETEREAEVTREEAAPKRRRRRRRGRRTSSGNAEAANATASGLSGAAKDDSGGVSGEVEIKAPAQTSETQASRGYRNTVVGGNKS